MEKVQQFLVDGMLYSMQSTFYPEDKVWCADVAPGEWKSEDAMRMDMLIHFLAEGDEEMTLRMSLWDCANEDELEQKFLAYCHRINNED